MPKPPKPVPPTGKTLPRAPSGNTLPRAPSGATHPRAPSGATQRMNSADPASANTAEKVQRGDTTRNPKAKVPSDLYPDPPGVDEGTKGGPDD
jgi:hypothetical protein